MNDECLEKTQDVLNNKCKRSLHEYFKYILENKATKTVSLRIMILYRKLFIDSGFQGLEIIY